MFFDGALLPIRRRKEFYILFEVSYCKSEPSGTQLGIFRPDSGKNPTN